MNKLLTWKIISAIELLLAVGIILFDVFNPTILILGIILISLLIRRESIGSLGFKKLRNAPIKIAVIFLLVVLWQLLQLSIFMPLMNHLTGTTQDLSTFADLKGNLGRLFFFLAVSWTLAAFGEELVYRGFLQKRITDLFGTNASGLVLSIGISSILFGLAHTEQGIIGVVLTTLDAILFSWLKFRNQNNLWGSILAHGFSNTIGLVAFYFIGPIYGFW
jgi:uncharacterized protein